MVNTLLTSPPLKCCLLTPLDTDNPELTDLVSDLAASNDFRATSIAHFERFLADNPPQGHPDQDAPPVTLKSFNLVGEGAAFRMTRGQRLRFLEELVRYMHACETEQLSEMSGTPPTIEEYLPCRMGTSAAGAVTAILEYVDLNAGNVVSMLISVDIWSA